MVMINLYYHVMNLFFFYTIIIRRDMSVMQKILWGEAGLTMVPMLREGRFGSLLIRQKKKTIQVKLLAVSAELIKEGRFRQ